MKGEPEDIEYQKLRLEVRKMLADMEHDVSQREHWARQRLYWALIAVLGFVAVLVNGFKSLWS